MSMNWTSEPAAGFTVEAENETVGTEAARVPLTDARKLSARTESAWRKPERVFMPRSIEKGTRLAPILRSL